MYASLCIVHFGDSRGDSSQEKAATGYLFESPRKEVTIPYFSDPYCFLSQRVLYSYIPAPNRVIIFK